MNSPFVPRLGGIVSADIAVPEHPRELRFYSRVLCTGEKPLWREGLMNNQGAPVIGLGEWKEEYADLPRQWMPHIQVADVGASVTRALELDGRELMHGKDADGNSQWAVLLDPTGAAFGLIPVVPAESMPAEADASSAVGHIAWLDLTVSDAARARRFYEEVVGWSARDVEMEDAAGRYTDAELCGGDGERAAGICHARGANQDLPSSWLLYLPVGDLGESLRRVAEEGGEVLRQAQQADGKVVAAVIQDPVGVSLALVCGSIEMGVSARTPPTLRARPAWTT